MRLRRSNGILKMHSGYLGAAYSDPSALIEDARDSIPVKFDTLVGTGLSGSLVIPMLARGLNCDWLIIRKDGDGSHSGLAAEGNLGRRWLFVDDFIASGATLGRVHKAIQQIVDDPFNGVDGRYKTEFVGAYLYDTPTFYAPDHAKIRVTLGQPRV